MITVKNNGIRAVAVPVTGGTKTVPPGASVDVKTLPEAVKYKLIAAGCAVKSAEGDKPIAQSKAGRNGPNR